MKKIIHNLRGQPEEIKRHVLHTTMIISAVILIFLWLFSLGRTLGDSETQTKMTENLEPFSALKDNIIGGYQNISEPDLNQELESLDTQY